MQAMDALVTLTDHIHQESSKTGQDSSCGSSLPSDEEEKKDQMGTFAHDRTKKSLPNNLRRLILRIQPYISPTNSSPTLAYKALQIFQNCVVYLAGRPMVTEQEAATFSSEDSANALIPCTLSAVAYELLPNFKAILSSDQAR